MVCPSLVTETDTKSHASSSNFMTSFMGQSRQSGKSVFIQNPDFLSTVKTSFRTLKLIPSADTSEVDPLSVPLAGKVGFQSVTEFRKNQFGLWI